MAIVTRYFSTSAAGAGDGTTWADRAALYSGGWSSVLVGHDFTTSGLKAMIGPGTHSIGANLNAASFTNAPNLARPLILHGCDSSGSPIAPNNPSWLSAQSALDISGFPELNFGSSYYVNLPHCSMRLIRVTSSYVGAVLQAPSWVDWCSIEHSGSSAGVGGIAGSPASHISNTQVVLTGAAYSLAIGAGANGVLNNVRVVAPLGSSGNRHGVSLNNAFQSFGAVGVCVIGTQVGIISADVSYAHLRRCQVVGAGSHGIDLSSITPTLGVAVSGLMVTGCGGYGLSVADAAIVSQSRFRDNTSGSINGLSEYPSDLGIHTTDSDDATEYVNAAGGDYRIKYGSAIWGQGYGVADEPAPAGGGGYVGRLRTIGA